MDSCIGRAPCIWIPLIAGPVRLPFTRDRRQTLVDKALSGRSLRMFNNREKLVQVRRQVAGLPAGLKLSTAKTRRKSRQRMPVGRTPGFEFSSTRVGRDFTITQLQTLFKRPTLALSLLVWNTLRDPSQYKGIPKATFRHNKSNKERITNSQLVHLLALCRLNSSRA